MFHCPNCNRVIIDQTDDGGYKLRSRMILFNKRGNAEAICPACKERSAIPLQLRLGQLVPYKNQSLVSR